MILGIDIGGTSAKLGLVNEEGSLLVRDEVDIAFDGYKTPLLQSVRTAAGSFLAREGYKVQGIGVSATGQIDSTEGVVIGTNGKIANYEGAQIKRDLEAALQLPTWVLNDANAATLGECFVGRARGLKHVLMLTLGTGVGGGIVVNGSIYGGQRGIAGELGHITLYRDGPLCPCGKRGCLESYASTTALVKLAEERCGEKLNGRIVFERAHAGDADMLCALAHWIGDIAEGITGLVHIFNPEMVLIGGGVSAQEELLIRPLRQRVLEGVMPRFSDALRLESALLGNAAGMIGAAKFFMDMQASNLE